MSDLSPTLQNIVEFRGVENLVAAKVLVDTEATFTTGPVFAIAGVATITRAASSNVEVHWYDNQPGPAIEGAAPDSITLAVSAIPLDVEAEISGQTYDETTGAMIEGRPEKSYYALGYIAKKTNGDPVYVWRLKGQFGTPDMTSSTEDSGTGANGQNLTYTGISTIHKFAKTGKAARALTVDVARDKADVSNFFATVTTPDTLVAKTSYTLDITAAANTTVTVIKNGETLSDGATIYAGDALTITVTGGTVTVNGTGFISGDTHNVTGNVTVVSTATP